jgi:hypothetical protein
MAHDFGAESSKSPSTKRSGSLWSSWLTRGFDNSQVSASLS